MVHLLHDGHQRIMRLMILGGSDAATVIHVVVELGQPLKLQFALSLMYPVALA
jgi:hypothetical protein